MLPVTRALPKEMLPLGNKPILQYAVEEAAASGLEEAILITRDDKPLERYFTSPAEMEGQAESGNCEDLHSLASLLSRIRVRAVHQNAASGLGDAVRCARSAVGDEAFALILPDAVMLADEPVVGQLMRSYAVDSGSYIATQKVRYEDIPRFGMLDLTESGSSGCGLFRVRGLSEKPRPEAAPSEYGVFGRYLLEPEIFDLLDHTRETCASELVFANALSRLCEKGRLYALCFAGRHFDAGDRLGYLKAVVEFGLAHEATGPALRDYISSLMLPIPAAVRD